MPEQLTSRPDARRSRRWRRAAWLAFLGLSAALWSLAWTALAAMSIVNTLA